MTIADALVKSHLAVSHAEAAVLVACRYVTVNAATARSASHNLTATDVIRVAGPHIRTTTVWFTAFNVYRLQSFPMEPQRRGRTH